MPRLLPDAERLRRCAPCCPRGSSAAGRHWNSRTVARWLSERAGRHVSVQTGWVYLRKLDHTLQLPRPRHVKAATPESRKPLKKTDERGGDNPGCASAGGRGGVGDG